MEKGKAGRPGVAWRGWAGVARGVDGRACACLTMSRPSQVLPIQPVSLHHAHAHAHTHAHTHTQAPANLVISTVPVAPKDGRMARPISPVRTVHSK